MQLVLKIYLNYMAGYETVGEDVALNDAEGKPESLSF